MRVLFGHRRGLPHTECGERAGGHDLAPSGVVAPLGLIRTVVFERAVLHEFAVEPAIARIADVFEEHAPQVRADLAYTSFVQCGYQFVCHRQTTPQISPACRRCEHLLHIKYVTVHILNYLPHSATPCRLQRVSLYFNIFQNVFQSRLHVFSHVPLHISQCLSLPIMSSRNILKATSRHSSGAPLATRIIAYWDS